MQQSVSSAVPRVHQNKPSLPPAEAVEYLILEADAALKSSNFGAALDFSRRAIVRALKIDERLGYKAYIQHGMALQKLGRQVEAAHSFNRAIAIGSVPRDPPSIFLRCQLRFAFADSLIRIGQPSDAEQFLRRTIVDLKLLAKSKASSAPDSRDIRSYLSHSYHALAACCVVLGKQAQARFCFGRAASLRRRLEGIASEQLEGIELDRGHLLARLGNMSQAEEHYRQAYHSLRQRHAQALDQAPQKDREQAALALLAIAQCCHEQQKAKEGREAFDQAYQLLTITPTDSSTRSTALFTKALVLITEGKFGAAIRAGHRSMLVELRGPHPDFGDIEARLQDMAQVAATNEQLHPPFERLVRSLGRKCEAHRPQILAVISNVGDRLYHSDNDGIALPCRQVARRLAKAELGVFSDGHAVTELKLADTYLQHGELKRARKLIRSSYRHFPIMAGSFRRFEMEHAELTLKYLSMRGEDKNTAAIQRTYKRIARLEMRYGNPGISTVLYHHRRLTRHLLRTGDVEGAARSLSEVRDLDSALDPAIPVERAARALTSLLIADVADVRGEHGLARTMYDRALGCARPLKDANLTGYCELTLVSGMFFAGEYRSTKSRSDLTTAVRALYASERAARNLGEESSFDRAKGLQVLSDLLEVLGKKTASERCYLRAYRMRQCLGDSDGPELEV